MWWTRIVGLVTGISLKDVMAFFSSPAGIIVLIVGAGFGGHLWGRHTAKAECRAEVARSVEQAKQMDVDIAKRAGARSAGDRAHNAELAATLEQQEKTYADELAAKGPACPIDDRDVGAIGGVQQPKLPDPVPLPPRRRPGNPGSRPAPAHSPR